MSAELHDIDPDDCVLVEFTNEFDKDGEKLLGVGYIPWLLQDDIINIADVISKQKEILMSWPVGIEISGNISFKAKLVSAKFKVVCVTVLYFGCKYFICCKS